MSSHVFHEIYLHIDWHTKNDQRQPTPTIEPLSFRTKKDRTLELTSAAYGYPKKGKYKITAKVIGIFGNYTTKVMEVTI